MPQRGRKKTPTDQKVVKGTFRKDRANEAEPEFEEDRPLAPEWLSARAGQIFGDLVHRLEGMGYASSSHTEMLSLAADALAEVEESEKTIRHYGRTFETTNSQGDWTLRNNPAVAQKSDAMRRAQSLLAEFGLSPSSATKVATPEKGEGGNRFGKLG